MLSHHQKAVGSDPDTTNSNLSQEPAITVSTLSEKMNHETVRLRRVTGDISEKRSDVKLNIFNRHFSHIQSNFSAKISSDFLLKFHFVD